MSYFHSWPFLCERPKEKHTWLKSLSSVLLLSLLPMVKQTVNNINEYLRLGDPCDASGLMGKQSVPFTRSIHHTLARLSGGQKKHQNMDLSNPKFSSSLQTLGRRTRYWAKLMLSSPVRYKTAAKSSKLIVVVSKGWNGYFQLVGIILLLLISLDLFELVEITVVIEILS